MPKKVLFTLLSLSFSIILYAQVNKELVMGAVKTADGKPAEYISEILNEVVVTGQFIPQSLRKSVYKVNVINAKEIEQKAPSSIQGLLNTELGIRMSNDMALGETKFELMGMSGANVKVLIDGVPLVDRGENKQSLSQIDINSIDRIEIVEGPMSVMYGSDALAGVINIITKKPEGLLAGKNLFSVSTRVREETAGKEYEFATGDGVHSENVNASFSHKSGWYTNAGFTRNASGGWTGDKTGREKEWQPKDQYLGNGSVGYRTDKLHVWYRLDYLDETIFTPLNAPATDPNEIVDRDFLTNRLTNQLQADWQLSNRLTLNMAGSYQDYKRDTKTVITNTSTGKQWLSTDASAQDKASNKALFFRSTASWKASSQLSLQPGVEYQWENAFGDRIEGKPEITDASVFLSAEYIPFEWMSLRPGVRSVIHSGYDAPPFIPSMNTKFNLTEKMELRLSYAYGFRAPTLRELYFSFHNANHNIDGNPDLKAEYSNNFSGSLSWRILHYNDIRLGSTLSGFYNIFRDRITVVPDENDINHNTYRNLEKYKTTGGTLENTLVWKDFQASLSFSYIGRYNSYVEDETYKGQDLDMFRFSPELTATVGYHWTKIDTNFNLFYKYTGARKEDALNDQKELTLTGMDSYNWADLTINKKFGKYFVLEGGVRNLFDLTTVTNRAGSGHGSSGTESFLGCGRSYFLGISYQFNNK